MNAGFRNSWKGIFDPAGGQFFYFDTLTRRSSWTKPPELEEDAILEMFEKRIDPASGKPFFFNPITKRSAWSLPTFRQQQGVQQTQRRGPQNPARERRSSWSSIKGMFKKKESVRKPPPRGNWGDVESALYRLKGAISGEEEKEQAPPVLIDNPSTFPSRSGIQGAPEGCEGPLEIRKAGGLLGASWSKVWAAARDQTFFVYKEKSSAEMLMGIDLTRLSGVEVMNGENEFGCFGKEFSGGVTQFRCSAGDVCQRWVFFLQKLRRFWKAASEHAPVSVSQESSLPATSTAMESAVPAVPPPPSSSTVPLPAPQRPVDEPPPPTGRPSAIASAATGLADHMSAVAKLMASVQERSSSIEWVLPPPSLTAWCRSLLSPDPPDTGEADRDSIRQVDEPIVAVQPPEPQQQQVVEQPVVVPSPQIAKQPMVVQPPSLPENPYKQVFPLVSPPPTQRKPPLEHHPLLSPRVEALIRSPQQPNRLSSKFSAVEKEKESTAFLEEEEEEGDATEQWYAAVEEFSNVATDIGLLSDESETVGVFSVEEEEDVKASVEMLNEQCHNGWKTVRSMSSGNSSGTRNERFKLDASQLSALGQMIWCLQRTPHALSSLMHLLPQAQQLFFGILLARRVFCPLSLGAQKLVNFTVCAIDKAAPSSSLPLSLLALCRCCYNLDDSCTVFFQKYFGQLFRIAAMVSPEERGPISDRLLPVMRQAIVSLVKDRNLLNSIPPVVLLLAKAIYSKLGVKAARAVLLDQFLLSGIVGLYKSALWGLQDVTASDTEAERMWEILKENVDVPVLLASVESQECPSHVPSPLWKSVRALRAVLFPKNGCQPSLRAHATLAEMQICLEQFVEQVVKSDILDSSLSAEKRVTNCLLLSHAEIVTLLCSLRAGLLSNPDLLFTTTGGAPLSEQSARIFLLLPANRTAAAVCALQSVINMHGVFGLSVASASDRHFERLTTVPPQLCQTVSKPDSALRREISGTLQESLQLARAQPSRKAALRLQANCETLRKQRSSAEALVARDQETVRLHLSLQNWKKLASVAVSQGTSDSRGKARENPFVAAGPGLAVTATRRRLLLKLGATQQDGDESDATEVSGGGLGLLLRTVFSAKSPERLALPVEPAVENPALDHRRGAEEAMRGMQQQRNSRAVRPMPISVRQKTPQIPTAFVKLR